MNNPNYDRKFPLILAGYPFDDLILKYDKIIHKLTELEKQYQVTHPGFDVSPLWACHCNNGQLVFNVTGKCYESALKNQLLEIFNEAGIGAEMDCQFY